MYFTANRRWADAVVWCFWFLVLLTVAWHGGPPWLTVPPAPDTAQGHAVALLVLPPAVRGLAWPWQLRRRWRKWALTHYQAAQCAYRRAVWAARGARLLLSGALTLAAVVDWLTRAQLRRQLVLQPHSISWGG